MKLLRPTKLGQVVLALSFSAMILITPSLGFSDDYISPELVKVSTPLYKPSSVDFEPPLGTYTYTVSWQGIPAAEAVATVSEEQNTFHITANARTYSGIDLFYRLRYNVDGLMNSYDFSPKKLVIEHQENSRNRNIQMNFSEDGEVYAEREQKSGEPPKILKFNPNNLMLDPIAATMLARSLPLEIGQTHSFDVFNGKSRYLISLAVTDRTTIDYKGEQRDVWVISPKVKNLTTTHAVEKLREAKIYVTADKARDVLRIVSDVFVGSVTTEMDSFVPSQPAFSNLQVAQALQAAKASLKR